MPLLLRSCRGDAPLSVIPLPQLLDSSQLVAVEGWQQEVKACLHCRHQAPSPSWFPIS